MPDLDAQGRKGIKSECNLSMLPIMHNILRGILGFSSSRQLFELAFWVTSFVTQLCLSFLTLSCMFAALTFSFWPDGEITLVRWSKPIKFKQ